MTSRCPTQHNHARPDGGAHRAAQIYRLFSKLCRASITDCGKRTSSIWGRRSEQIARGARHGSAFYCFEGRRLERHGNCRRGRHPGDGRADGICPARRRLPEERQARGRGRAPSPLQQKRITAGEAQWRASIRLLLRSATASGRASISLGVNMMRGNWEPLTGPPLRAVRIECGNQVRSGLTQVSSGLRCLDALKSEGTAGGCGRF
jgi:hypothetical protein